MFSFFLSLNVDFRPWAMEEEIYWGFFSLANEELEVDFLGEEGVFSYFHDSCLVATKAGLGVRV